MMRASQERARVLIVEDDPAQAEALSLVLAGDDREILVAADGEAGLSLARAGVELIVADYMLPGINGLKMVQKLPAARIVYAMVRFALNGPTSHNRTRTM